MAFLPIERILESVQRILRDRLALRQSELVNQGCATCPPVKEWRIGDWDFPGNGQGAYPLGIVDVDEPVVESERREQDTGETLTVNLVAAIYFEEPQPDKGRARIQAVRYGDLLRYCVNREAKGVDPRDRTVLPGLFRMWATTMRIGSPESFDLMGAEVNIKIIVDVSQAYAVT